MVHYPELYEEFNTIAQDGNSFIEQYPELVMIGVFLTVLILGYLQLRAKQKDRRPPSPPSGNQRIINNYY